MGAKNRFRYKKKAKRSPMVSEWCATMTAADGQKGGLAENTHQLRPRPYMALIWAC